MAPRKSKPKPKSSLLEELLEWLQGKSVTAGVDTGASGGMFILQRQSAEPDAEGRFISQDRLELDEWADLLMALKSIDAFVVGEELNLVSASLKGNAYTKSKQGLSLGRWQGLLAASKVRHMWVSSKEWPKAIGGVPQFSGPDAYEERKKEYYSRAKKLFPSSKITRDGADAALIAVYARTHIGGIR